MKEFIRKHEDRIHGDSLASTGCCFAATFRSCPAGRWHNFSGLELNGSSLKPFLLQNSERVKNNALAMAQKHGRPFQYLSSHIRKEDTARQLAERDGLPFSSRPLRNCAIAQPDMIGR